MQETLLTINLQRIQQNALQFKRNTERFLYAVVKADAYGHGAIKVTDALQMVADGFAVALIDEAIAIKTAAAGKEILVFTPPTSEEDVVIAANNGFTLTAAGVQSARLIVETLCKYDLTASVQVKVNTGMNRYGVYGSNLGKVCTLLKRAGQVRVQGVYSHLYSQSPALCERQRFRFCQGVAICRRYFPLARAHLASTFGAALGSEYLFDGVRIGLGLYGYFPEGEAPFPLLPAMQAFAPCVAKRKHLFGGALYGDDRDELFGQELSLLRAGYADGMGFSVQRSGLKCDVVSNLCMDVCLTNAKGTYGKYTCLFDDALKVAEARGTSVYEVLCLAALRAKRKYYY